MNQGIRFNGKGLEYVKFKKPRIIGLYVNFLSCSSWAEYPKMQPLCIQAKNFEVNNIGFMSSSSSIELDINDKLFTRSSLTEPLTILLNSSDDASKKTVADKIKEFVSMIQYNQIVIKPSGPRFCSCDGVKIFKLESEGDLEGAVDHVLHLLSICSDNDSVLVDKKIESPTISLDKSTFNGPVALLDHKFDWVLRVVCAKNANGETCGGLARVGKRGAPVNAGPNGGFWTSIEDAFRRAEISNWDECFREIKDLGRKFFEEWSQYEKTMTRADGGPYRAETMMVGLDVMLHLDGFDEHGKPIASPYIIEVNDHDCGGFDAYDILTPGNEGGMIRGFINAGLQRIDSIKDELLKKLRNSSFDLSKEETIYECPLDINAIRGGGSERMDYNCFRI
ncbi:hypothetical protein ROZALSC1DRAFT_27452 [Rozella allomycis CSF55]|uniref:Uncharacterized protein n=1 Tax=Rozella allomycis (strain CSF55) TaxID=988480 RepID=A0A075ASW7_ROZAC|nr:hypothetical protein O9G_001616 [Rozella allomycis CSF55]RKP21107.1 hypothetical protein ROZALSC1DRAFT_27452 [Rozella allomycis CSF55]|eukprot:EPZ33265.1 hypothetical protein O9G_001616 [Rozella allomycis CSF55]